MEWDYSMATNLKNDYQDAASFLEDMNSHGIFEAEVFVSQIMIPRGWECVTTPTGYQIKTPERKRGFIESHTVEEVCEFTTDVRFAREPVGRLFTAWGFAKQLCELLEIKPDYEYTAVYNLTPGIIFRNCYQSLRRKAESLIEGNPDVQDDMDDT